MKKVTITYSAKRTFPLENYANLTPCYSITEELTVPDDYVPTEDFERLREAVTEELGKERKRVEEYKQHFNL